MEKTNSPMQFRRLLTHALVATAVLLPAMGRGAVAERDDQAGSGAATSTPIKHLVVIFQENVSFDHYFGTYPHAQNPAGEPTFIAAEGTPTVDGLDEALLTANPNAANPKRLGRSQAMTCDMDHDYTHEQKAFNSGLMDKFVEFASGGGCKDKTLVMDYYDGNTVTALWNYAQHFAMSDNSFSDTFGPSTPGALNLVAGQTHGATPPAIKDEVSNGTITGDPRPALDECWKGSRDVTATMSGRNVGDLLNEHKVSWGWFQGGFRPTGVDAAGKAVCGSQHANVGGNLVKDYIPHHQPFQYYPQTANPAHTPPASVDEIGVGTGPGTANHQYDLVDFWAAADAGKMPAVSYLKAAAYQDGHAGYSDPLDEQTFLVETINRLQQLPTWSSTAVIIAYDDSDGWYDHVMGPILTQSSDPQYDALTGAGLCGVAKAGAYQDRCGLGPRQPLLVVSPFARRNFVDHSTTAQASILRFVEDNWSLGRLGDQSFDARDASLSGLFDFAKHDDGERAERLILDPATGQPVH
jgi:phospholipase C